LLDEGKLGNKNQTHLLKGKTKSTQKESQNLEEYLDHKPHKHDGIKSFKKNCKKKTSTYCGNFGHAEKTCFKKRDYLNHKFESIETK